VRKALTVSSLCIFVWLGCGGPSPGESPSEVLERYLRASASGDWPVVYQLSSTESREGVTQEEFVAWRLTLPNDFATALEKRTTRELLSEKVDGEKAEVKLRIEIPDFSRWLIETGDLPTPEQLQEAPLHQLERSFPLVKEPSGWKMIVPIAPKASRDQPQQFGPPKPQPSAARPPLQDKL
jgi:hypothetical protein